MDKALTTVINIISFCGSIIEFADKVVSSTRAPPVTYRTWTLEWTTC